jgi:hypothetical protein
VEILLGIQAAKQVEDIGGAELNVLGTGNKAGVINTLYILGLKTAARVKEEGISKEES